MKKYVICNADEGDPGAFMDRSAIEGDPAYCYRRYDLSAATQSVAKQGYRLISGRNILLQFARLEKAIARPPENMVSSAIIFLGSEFSFDIDIRLGAGAFVCGEETAPHPLHRRRPWYAKTAPRHIRLSEGLFGKADPDK